jgi:hypothetical protein
MSTPRDVEEPEVEQPVPSASGDEDAPQQTEGEDGMNRTDIDIGYDFEVKEQDRWLPIANGALHLFHHVHPFCLSLCSFGPMFSVSCYPCVAIRAR